MAARVDHLVVAAASLEQGAAWCEATLGVTPGPGGEHPLMGTHNRLLRIATVDYPRAYFEIIAIQPGRQPQRARRWFDLDDESVRDTLAREGPRLLHFVASVSDAAAGVAAWRGLGLERGEPVAASRMTPRGPLSWQITLRDDGQRLLDGLLPTLIEWGDAHPASALPESGVTLQSLTACHPQAATLRAAYEAVGLQGVAVKEGAADLCAVLDTPRGRVKLASQGL
ncbi:VOC family protein [Ramlibacter sp. USB13]|uniref:VOC family protein n=1 Tax=Ramlibacter cellulosilyticus TaxID=2764187 RepID=A0A923MST9_9BURK|nr:VOC family protein [Ramlibacter cellulosilyticus]MBC5783974.1 VOC family protein [Ramlibacter cellulosilyticus]